MHASTLTVSVIALASSAVFGQNLNINNSLPITGIAPNVDINNLFASFSNLTSGLNISSCVDAAQELSKCYSEKFSCDASDLKCQCKNFNGAFDQCYPKTSDECKLLSDSKEDVRKATMEACKSQGYAMDGVSSAGSVGAGLALTAGSVLMAALV